MKKSILILILAISVFAADKPADNNFNLIQKQIELKLSVEGKAPQAASECLAKLKSEKLSKEQTSSLQQLLKRAAYQSDDLLIAREAAAYLTAQNVECNKLKQKLSLGLPDNLNTNLNKNIREALNYQWNNLKWQTDRSDYKVFDGYLAELTQNTNITETARAQTTLLRTIIPAWKDFAYILELDFKIVERQYKRLIFDLQCPRDKVKEVEVKNAINRFYESANEYMQQKHPYLAIIAIRNLSCYTQYVPENRDLKDIFRVQINRLNKKTSFILCEKYNEPKLEKNIPSLLYLSKKIDSCLTPQRFTLRLEYHDNYEFDRIKLFSWFYYKELYCFKSKIKVPPENFNVYTNLISSSFAHFFINVVFPNNKLIWKEGENKEVKMGNQKILVKRDWFYTVPIGKWNQVVWNTRFSKLQNDISKLEPAINEIRKYVYNNYEKERIEKQQKKIENKKIRDEYHKLIDIFAENGPKVNKKAMKARDELLKILSKNPDLASTEFVNVLRKYPEITENSIDILARNLTFSMYNWDQWRALRFYNEIKKFQKTISTVQNPELIIQLKDSFFDKIYRSGIQHFFNGDFPAFRASYKYIQNADNNNLSITNFVVVLASELKRIADGYSYLDNYIHFFDEWIPVAVNAEQSGSKYALYPIIKIIDNKFDWQAKARIELARKNIYSYHNLPKNIRLRKTVEALVELQRGLREDAGLSTNNVDWVKKLGLDKPDISEKYKLIKIYSPERPIMLMRATKLNPGIALQVKINGRIKFTKVGQTILDKNKKPLYKIGNVTFKKIGVWNQMINSTQYVDKSTVQIKNLQTDENFRLTLGEKSFAQPEAVLLRLSDNKKLTVNKGDKIPYNKKISSEIIDIDKQKITFLTGDVTNILNVSATK